MYVKKKKKKKKNEENPAVSKTPKPNGKARNEGKKKKRKEKKGRGESETKKVRDPSCRDTVMPLPTPTRERPILLSSTHAAISCCIPKPETHLAVAVGCSICTAHVRETHLATQYTCRH